MTLLLRRATAMALVGPAVAAVALTAATPPAEAVTPAVASVTVSIRSGATHASTRLATLDRGQRVVAVGPARRGWVPIEFRDGHAYVAARYVTTSRSAVPAAPSRLSPAGLKVTTNRLNLRIGPSVGRGIVMVLPIGTMVRLTNRQAHGFGLVVVGSGKRAGWVSLAYLANMATPPPVAHHFPVRTRPSTTRHRSTGSAAQGRIALAFARRQLGDPYVFGATGPSSWDCSGLVQAAWRAAGVDIPRTSEQQFAHGGTRIAYSQLRPGDLVFFYGPSPHHVGMYVGGGMIINAPRPGRSVDYTAISNMPYAGAVRP